MKKWLECSLLEGSTGCGGSSQCRKACVDGEAMKVEERSGDDHEQRDNESEDTEHLRLLSQEGTIFHVSLKHARMMQTISWMIDGLYNASKIMMLFATRLWFCFCRRFSTFLFEPVFVSNQTFK